MSKQKMSKNVKWGGGIFYYNKLTSNKKYIVLLLIFLIGILTLYINTSYGLFKKKDYLTSIDFVAGTLDYKIESDALTNNSITVPANGEYKFDINLTSLNSIDSKYELYYLINGKKVDNPNIEIGYTNESIDSVKGIIAGNDGTINSNASKNITVSIKNKGDESVNVTFGCEGGLINNELVMSLGNSLDSLIMSDDLIVAYTYVGEDTEPDRFPNKFEGYEIKSVTCNGMDAVWSNLDWSLTFSNLTGKNITCNFEIDDQYATDYIELLSERDTDELRVDTHQATGQQTFATTEYRYWSKTPKNYVLFNNELWRIIGVFDVDDGSAGLENVGKVERRLKIIRNESIGNYSWDSSASSINYGYGINEWSQADLMQVLNSGPYYNSTTGTCYNAINDATTSCDFSKNSSTPGLTTDAKEMIGNAKWYIGGESHSDEIYTDDSYEYERGTLSSVGCLPTGTNGKYCNDTVTRTTAWVGQVGLMYPSDYGYSADMSKCTSTVLGAYNTVCYNTSWMFQGVLERTLNSWNSYWSASYIYNISNVGNVTLDIVGNGYAIRPTVYLLQDIKIVGGEGTADQPYQLSLN